MDPKFFWVCNILHDQEAFDNALAGTPAKVFFEDVRNVKVTTSCGYTQVVRCNPNAANAKLSANVAMDAPHEAAIAVMALAKALGGLVTNSINETVQVDTTPDLAKALGVQSGEIIDLAEAYRLVKLSVRWDRMSSHTSIWF